MGVASHRNKEVLRPNAEAGVLCVSMGYLLKYQNKLFLKCSCNKSENNWVFTYQDVSSERGATAPRGFQDSLHHQKRFRNSFLISCTTILELIVCEQPLQAAHHPQVKRRIKSRLRPGFHPVPAVVPPGVSFRDQDFVQRGDIPGRPLLVAIGRGK